MPFIAPLIAGAIGLGAVGSAVLQVGLAVGLSFAATKLRPKVKNAKADTQSGVRLGLQIDTNPPRQVIIGETATSGSLVYWQLSGTDNKVLHMVFALADHECNSLQGVLVNNKLKSRDAGTGEITGYGSSLIVRFYSGVAGQTADSELVSTSGGRWTSNDVGTGVCYVVVKMTYDEKLFPEGIPDFGFVVRGAKLTDPRTGTAAYSDNPAVAIFNILRGITVGGEKLVGMNVPVDAIRDSEAEAAANACDELIAKKAGGTEKRYRCNVVLDATQSSRDMIETLLSSMAGEVIEAGGIYRIMAGVAQTPVAALTDADIIVTEPLVTRPKRSRNEIVNAVQGSFTDPSRAYGPVALPPRTSSTDEDADGGIRLTRSLDLVAVTSRSQAQRILEVERRRARRMASASMKVRARWFGLEPGDWITYSSERRGYVEKTFVIQSKTGNRDLTSDIVLVETDAAIDDWTAATDEIDDDQVIDLASAGPGLSSVSGIDVDAIVITGPDGTQRPGLVIEWTAVTDPTVVSLLLEYRKVGDSVALQRQISDPASAVYAWVDGIQGGLTYEARLRPVTLPERSTTWSSWFSSASESEPQVVSAAAIAYEVPPDTITAEMLSAQTRFELSLIFEVDSVLGSASQMVADTIASAEQAHIATINALLDSSENRASIRVEERIRQEQDLFLAEQITTVVAQLGAQAATVQQQFTAIATDLDAQAQALQTVTTTVAGQSAQVTVLAQSINGVESKFGVAVSNNGEVLGLVQLDANAVAGSTFSVLADNFRVSKLGTAGGAAVQVFGIQTVNGVTKLALRGDMYADGTITANKLSVASLSALSADLGEVTAGLIRNAANTLRFDLPNMRLYRADGKADVDLSVPRIRFTP